MFARSTSVLGDPADVDRGIAYVRDEVLPSATAVPGCLGLSMLVDRETGLSLVTTSWSSEDAMRSSNLHLAPMRIRGGRIVGGPPRIGVWEVAVMHRRRAAPPGACCRVTWLCTDPMDIDRGIRAYRAAVLPEMEVLPGFCSASLFVDRGSGAAATTTTYATRRDLDHTRERGWSIRDVGARDTGVEVTDVAECELVLAHLRVPELV